MTVLMDQIVLFNGDGTVTPSDPLWGQFRTYILDIDDRSHRQWLNNQRYKLGDKLVAHKFISDNSKRLPTIAPSVKSVVHIPTNGNWATV